MPALESVPPHVISGNRGCKGEALCDISGGKEKVQPGEPLKSPPAASLLPLTIKVDVGLQQVVQGHS